MTATDLLKMSNAEWLAAPVGEDAQPSEPRRPLSERIVGSGVDDEGRTFITVAER